MTKNEMKTKLCLYKGIGVEVTDKNGKFYYFYEDFAGDAGMNRAYRHFNKGEKLVFYSSSWARQEQFKEYMEHYRKMEKGTEKQLEYIRFLAGKLAQWSSLDMMAAAKQIILERVSYSLIA